MYSAPSNRGKRRVWRLLYTRAENFTGCVGNTRGVRMHFNFQIDRIFLLLLKLEIIVFFFNNDAAVIVF